MNEYKKHFSADEIISIMDDIVAANQHTAELGIDDTIAMEIEGVAGTGKSSIVEQYAKDNGLGFYILNLPSLTEETQITGFPRETLPMELKVEIKEKNEEGEIVTKIKRTTKDVRIEDVNSYKEAGWVALQEDSEMTYSPPAFVNYLSKFKKGSIIFFDESRRSLPHILQGSMNLINNGRFANWKLPANCLRVEANNPNNGEYNVQSIDEAGETRKFTFRIKFDKESWMAWASKNNIREECMNFFYLCDEARNYENKEVKTPNPRVWVRFFRSIAHLNFKDSSNYNKIYRNGVGSIGEDFVLLFQSFITNNLDIIPNLSWVFDSKTNHIEAIKSLKACVTDIDDTNVNNKIPIVRTDIQGLLGMRLKTYLRATSKITEAFKDRLMEIFKSNVLGEAIMTMIVLDIFSDNHPNASKLKTSIISLTRVREILTNNNIDFSTKTN